MPTFSVEFVKRIVVTVRAANASEVWEAAEALSDGELDDWSSLEAWGVDAVSPSSKATTDQVVVDGEWKHEDDAREAVAAMIAAEDAAAQAKREAEVLARNLTLPFAEPKRGEP